MKIFVDTANVKEIEEAASLGVIDGATTNPSLIAKEKRPAFVLLDTNDGDVILCRITSQASETKYDINISNWKNYGLLLPSCIRIHKIATMDKELIERKLGKLDTITQDEFKKTIGALLQDFMK